MIKPLLRTFEVQSACCYQIRTLAFSVLGTLSSHIGPLRLKCCLWPWNNEPEARELKQWAACQVQHPASLQSRACWGLLPALHEMRGKDFHAGFPHARSTHRGGLPGPAMTCIDIFHDAFYFVFLLIGATLGFFFCNNYLAKMTLRCHGGVARSSWILPGADVAF